MFVRSKLIVAGDAAATAANIGSHQVLFRIGFISDLIMVMSDVGVALLFYILLKEVNAGLSLLASFFRLAQATVLGLNLLNLYMPLLLLGQSDYLGALSENGVNGLAMLFLTAHGYGYLISGVFFGVSCVILGYLLFKASFFPRWLGVLVISAGGSYLVDSMTNFVVPQYAHVSEILVVTVAVISELSLCLFLLIKGVGVPPGKQQAHPVQQPA